MISVKTPNKDLEFRVQGKMANSEKPIRVTVDHNVQCKLNDGSLIEDKVEVKKENKSKKKDFNPSPALSENDGSK